MLSVYVPLDALGVRALPGLATCRSPLLIDRCNACIGSACCPLTTPDSASEQPGCTVALPHTLPSNQKSYHEDIPRCQIRGSIGGCATALIVLSPNHFSLSSFPAFSGLQISVEVEHDTLVLR